LQPLDDSEGNCYEVGENYPAKGFVFILTDNDTESFLESSYKLISYLEQQNIAHNVFLTRGSSQNRMQHFDSVRLFVWAREANYGK